MPGQVISVLGATSPQPATAADDIHTRALVINVFILAVIGATYVFLCGANAAGDDFGLNGI